MFAAAAQVPRLMQQLEQGPLSQYTPCKMNSAQEQQQRSRSCTLSSY
jgi:hypothetical protein